MQLDLWAEILWDEDWYVDLVVDSWLVEEIGDVVGGVIVGTVIVIDEDHLTSFVRGEEDIQLVEVVVAEDEIVPETIVRIHLHEPTEQLLLLLARHDLFDLLQDFQFLIVVEVFEWDLLEYTAPHLFREHLIDDSRGVLVREW